MLKKTTPSPKLPLLRFAPRFVIDILAESGHEVASRIRDKRDLLERARFGLPCHAEIADGIAENDSLLLELKRELDMAQLAHLAADFYLAGTFTEDAENKKKYFHCVDATLKLLDDRGLEHFNQLRRNWGLSASFRRFQRLSK